MFKRKKTSSHVSDYAALSKYLRVTENKTLYCDACDSTIASDKKSHVTQHLDTSRHTCNVDLKESACSSGTQSSLTFESKRAEFIHDICELFVGLNIPMKKSKHMCFRRFVEKYTSKRMPSESSLRCQYLPSMYAKTRNLIRDELKSGPLYAVVDETTDREGRYICNVLVGSLKEDGPSAPHLIAVKHLERTNSETVSRCLDESLCNLFGNNSARDRLLLLLTDAAAYMKLAEKLLSSFYPKMTHVTCLVHGLHRVCETIKAEFPLVNQWISTMKKVFLKSPSRVRVYRELYPDLPLPPEPIETRFGTWIEAAEFHAEHYEKLLHVIQQIDRDDDAICVQKARDLIKNDQIALDLVYVRGSYGFIAMKLRKLEDPQLPLCEALSILDSVVTKINAAVGLRAKTVQTKINKVLQNNSGLTFMRQVDAIIKGEYTGSTSEVMEKLTVKEVLALKFAQLTSCDVERSFSIYKIVLTERRTNFSVDNLEMYLICNYYINRRKCENRMKKTKKKTKKRMKTDQEMRQ